jgi:hypothetical protein
MKDKFRYFLYPERVYVFKIAEKQIEISGKEIVERIIDGQKSKEAERKTSELSETQS